MVEVKFIGIQKIWYGAVFTSAVTAAGLKTWLSANTTTEVTNSHEGTWGYTQDDPTTEDYINELTGKPYHRDLSSAGVKTITWTSGMYDLDMKAALQGGTATTTSWTSGAANFVYKGVVAKTKTGHYIVFTNANIIAKADQQQKAIGLGVSAVAMENENSGVADEYWFVGSAVDTE